MTTTLSTSESETLALAAAFAATLKPGDAVALRGPLGAGKTLFARGVVRALGFEGPVSSPSYALVHEYAGRVPVYHMDLYRLAPGSDWEEIGLAHYLDPSTSSGGPGRGICLIEWSERLPEGWNPFTHEVTLEVAGEMERKIQISP
jgi:tRNA threonylcarbamoyladenosine biosynthesis protein TsaE